MAEPNELKPSYASTGQADKLLDLFRRVTPQKVDAKFLVDNGITTAANAAAVLKFAEWLGLIDKDGIVVTEKVSKLKLVGAERNTYIADLIKTSYKDLFDRVNLETATRDDVVNYFVHNYALGSAAAQQAGILFLHMCQVYGIPISEGLKKKVYAPSGQPRAKPVTRSSASKIEDSSKLQDHELGREVTQRKGSGIEITVRGFGLETNQQNTMVARTPKELEDVLATEFKVLMDYSKMQLKKINTANAADGGKP